MIPLHRLFSASAILMLASTAHAFSPQGDAPDTRPKYAFLRQAEDWSKFHAGSPPEDFADPIKHISLSDDDFWWVSLGGRLEARYEDWSNFGFLATPNGTDSFIVSRALLHADLHAGKNVRAYVEGKTAQATERDLPGGRRTLDMDTLALQQAFVDWTLPIGDAKLTLRAGRQMHLLGAQRLISPLPWGNTLRTWEGLTAFYNTGPWTITGIASEFVPVNKTETNKVNDEFKLFALYAKRNPDKGGHGLEFYALSNTRPNVTINGTSGDESRQTFGTRVWGPMGERTSYEVEASLQSGEVGNNSVSAWSVASKATWMPSNMHGDPALWIGLDAASGDDEVGGDVGTFNQIYPLGHAYFGYIDAIGRQNIADVSLGGKWNLMKATDIALAYHYFRVMETTDAIYNAGGAPTRTGFDSKDIGSEIDLTLNHNMGRHTQIYGGYSHFMAGDAISESGPDEDIDFAYVGMRFTF